MPAVLAAEAGGLLRSCLVGATESRLPKISSVVVVVVVVDSFVGSCVGCSSPPPWLSRLRSADLRWDAA